MRREEVGIGESTPLGVSTLFRTLGGGGNVSGPGIFMLRTMAIGSCAGPSAVYAPPPPQPSVFGTGSLPFVLGASVSFFTFSMMYYRSCVRQAMLAVERYPHLMLLHIDGNYPGQKWDMARLRSVVSGRGGGGWVDQSMLVAAWQTAGGALDEIQTQKENSMVARILEQTARLDVPDPKQLE
ncbi:hypothetical protein ACLMJK_002464 [Lecanora helva]